MSKDAVNGEIHQNVSERKEGEEHVVHGDDGSEGSWSMLGEDANENDSKGDSESAIGENSYVNVDDLDDDDMSALQKLASIEKVPTLVSESTFNMSKPQPIHLEMVEMTKETETNNTTAKNVNENEEDHVHVHVHVVETTTISEDDDSVQEEAPTVPENPVCPTCKCHQPHVDSEKESDKVTEKGTNDNMKQHNQSELDSSPKKETITISGNTFAGGAAAAAAAIRRSFSCGSCEMDGDDKSVEAQMFDNENDNNENDNDNDNENDDDSEGKNVNPPEAKYSESESSSPPSILKRASSVPLKREMRTTRTKFTRTRSVHPKEPSTKAAKKNAKNLRNPKRMDRASSFLESTSVMKPNPVTMVRPKTSYTRSTPVEKLQNPAKKITIEEPRPKNNATIPKLPKGVSSDDERKGRSTKVDRPQTTPTPTSSQHKPMDFKKVRTANTVGWQFPVQSSFKGAEKEKEVAVSKIDKVLSKSSSNAEEVPDVMDEDSVASASQENKDEIAENTDVQETIEKAEEPDVDDDCTHAGSITSAITSATNASVITEKTEKAGNRSIRKLKVFGSPVKSISEKEGALWTSRTPRVNRKRTMKKTKGLGRKTETVEASDTKSANSPPRKVIKPTKIETSKQKKSRFTLKMW